MNGEGPVVEVYGCSDPGLVRESNEDFFILGDLDQGEILERTSPSEVRVTRRGPLLLVCDGMGGVEGGGIASETAANAIWAAMRESAATDEAPVYARLLRRAIRTGNQKVREVGRQEARLRGMGTTVSAAGIAGDLLILAQVGDSRAYIQRGSTLTQLTRDQSVVSALVQAGRMTEKEAESSIQKGMILQALGTGEDVEVALSIVELREGDRLLLCSDGLHGPVGDAVMRTILDREDDMVTACEALLAAARAAGAPDNVTAVLARFSGGDLRPPLGDDDAPRFTEFDPMEEGERALTDTSQVGRRLARRAGLRTDTLPPSIPATGQHRVVSFPKERRGESRSDEPAGPADAILAERQRLGVIAWTVAAVVVLGLAAVLLLDLL